MLERAIETLIFGSRWLLVPLYLGLAAVLLLFAGKALLEIAHLFQQVMVLSESELLLGILSLIDFVLVANLLVMVMLSSYETFVSRIDVGHDAEKPAWLGKIDAGAVKIKLAGSIVAISSIHLLKVFMNLPKYDITQVMWLAIVHMVFVVSALLMAWVDRIAFGGHDH